MLTDTDRVEAALTSALQTAPQLARAARVNPCTIYQNLWDLRREGRAKCAEVKARRDKPRLFWSLPDPTPAAPPAPPVAPPAAQPPKVEGFLTPDMTQAERIAALRARVARFRANS